MSVDFRRAFEHFERIQRSIIDRAPADDVVGSIGAAARDLIRGLDDPERTLDPDERRVLDSLAGLAYLAANDADAAAIVDRSAEREDFDARHDQLTGAPNRRQALAQLETWATSGSGS